MISVNVNTNGVRKAVSADINQTPYSVFQELDIDTSRAMVCLNGATLGAADFNATFEALNVADGTTCTLSAIVKADGARA